MEPLTDRVMVEQLRWNTIFMGKVTDIAFTSNFCNNYSHPASLYFTSLRPCPTCPRVPYLMSSSPSSRVLNSQVPTQSCIPMPPSPCPLPLLYTAPQKEKKMMQEKHHKKSERTGEERKWKEKVKTAVCGMSGTFNPKTILKFCFLHMPYHHKLIFCIGIRRP